MLETKYFKFFNFSDTAKSTFFLYISVIHHIQQISGSYSDIPKLRMVSWQIVTEPNYSTKPVKFKKPCLSLSFVNRT